MRIGIGVGGDPSDEQLIQAQQMGCAGVVIGSPTLPWNDGWSYDDLACLRRDRVVRSAAGSDPATPLDQLDLIRLGLPDTRRPWRTTSNRSQSRSRRDPDPGLQLATEPRLPDRHRCGGAAGRG
jgi:hypothetical protein